MTKRANKYRLFSYREIFYVITENLIAAKLLSHVPNSVLRVINNDTYEELPLVFNRLAPHIFTKNKVITFVQKKTNVDFRLNIEWLYLFG